jgi:hypothetical protein
MRRGGLSLGALLAVALTAQAQGPDEPRKLRLRPAAAPTPALKYRLLPELADMKPGNAALLYQRAHSFEWWTTIRRLEYYHEISDWLDRPFKEVPRDKVDFLRQFPALHEVDLAARREHCDWEMTPRLRKEGLRMLFPEVQGFREYAMLLAMRSRLEMADKDYDKAVYTFQTGFGLGRHVGESPTLITALVGNAICSIVLDRVEELMQAPGSPNLYWGLTNLPRPMIDLRRPLEGETLMFRAEFPGVEKIETDTLSPQEQKRLLKKLDNPELWGMIGLERETRWWRKLGFAGLAMKAYPKAKRALIAQGRKPEEVEALPVLQVILIEAMRHYDRYRDEGLKWFNLPYPQARAALKKLDEQARIAVKEHPAAILALLFVPATQKVYEATVRLDRRIAALRCIEAIRLHAAAHGGNLPARLSDITAVPIPDDPATGKAFVYAVDGDRATLRDPPGADGRPALHTPMYYAITFKR